MSGKLFNKDIKKSCAWCIHGKKSEYTDDVYCIKRGVTSGENCCRKYKYDPLKRTPDTKSIDKDFKPEDFSLG
ncbi:MAG: hypothetical protein J5662_09660 [Clostridia bacterium]|nr:hypothetical protein [Clostridia bacterium]